MVTLVEYAKSGRFCNRKEVRLTHFLKKFKDDLIKRYRNHLSMVSRGFSADECADESSDISLAPNISTSGFAMRPTSQKLSARWRSVAA